MRIDTGDNGVLSSREDITVVHDTWQWLTGANAHDPANPLPSDVSRFRRIKAHSLHKIDKRMRRIRCPENRVSAAMLHPPRLQVVPAPKGVVPWIPYPRTAIAKRRAARAHERKRKKNPSRHRKKIISPRWKLTVSFPFAERRTSPPGKTVPSLMEMLISAMSGRFPASSVPSIRHAQTR